MATSQVAYQQTDITLEFVAQVCLSNRILLGAAEILSMYPLIPQSRAGLFNWGEGVHLDPKQEVSCITFSAISITIYSHNIYSRLRSIPSITISRRILYNSLSKVNHLG